MPHERAITRASGEKEKFVVGETNAGLGENCVHAEQAPAVCGRKFGRLHETCECANIGKRVRILGKVFGEIADAALTAGGFI